jgi:predicted lipoprotein with Yx(FWY)xxD motif
MRKSGWAAAAGLVSAALLLTACGGGSSSSSSSSGGSTPTTGAVSTNTANPSASAGESSPPPGTVYFFVQHSAKGWILAEGGKPVYTYSGDTAGKPATCTGSCAAVWKPVAAQNPQPSAADNLPGKFTSIDGVAAYNGMPLYTHVGGKDLAVYPDSSWHLVPMKQSYISGG